MTRQYIEISEPFLLLMYGRRKHTCKVLKAHLNIYILRFIVALVHPLNTDCGTTPVTVKTETGKGIHIFILNLKIMSTYKWMSALITLSYLVTHSNDWSLWKSSTVQWNQIVPCHPWICKIPLVWTHRVEISCVGKCRQYLDNSLNLILQIRHKYTYVFTIKIYDH